MTAFSRLSVTTGLALLLGLGVGACNPPPGQPGMSSLTENRCGVHRVAGEATSEYVMCVMGTRGTAEEVRAAELVAETMRSDRARQGERKCDVYQLSRDTSEFIKCQHHAAITVQARERAVDEAAARRSPTFENQALRR